MKKYELTGETKSIGKHTLYRIRACININGVVNIGELGGWVESEQNLSHDDNAWVCGDAQVYGDAWVYDNARVYGYARVCGDARVYGNARVCGDAQVYGDAWNESPLYVQGSKWSVYMTDLTHIQIGCQNHSISDWINHGVAIACRNNSSDIVPEYVWYVATAAMQYGAEHDKENAWALLDNLCGQKFKANKKAPDAAATAIERKNK